jgi:hypothetical protein
MKEDYLWDKSGEIDEDVEKLENVLGRLRYQRSSQPLPLPAVSRPWWRLNSTLLAAAATVVLLLLAGGLLLKLQHTSFNGNEISAGPTPTPGPVVPFGNESPVVKNPEDKLVNPPAPQNVAIPQMPNRRSQFVRVTYSGTKSPRALREEKIIREGEFAKEQLLKALQITSEKLNIVQRKIQGSHDAGPIS